MHTVACPRCRGDLDVAAADLGFPVECPLCRTAFTAPAEAPRPRRRYIDDREDDDDEYEYRRPDPRRRERDRQKAEQIIARPASAMAWVGSIGTALSLLGGVGLSIAGIAILDGGGPDAGAGVACLIYAVLIGGFGLALHLPMLIGAHRVKRLDGTGWGYAAAALGIGAFVTLGPCFITPCFGLGFGIWLLSAMGKPEVKRTIRANQRDREAREADRSRFRPPAEPDYDDRDRRAEFDDRERY